LTSLLQPQCYANAAHTYEPLNQFQEQSEQRKRLLSEMEEWEQEHLSALRMAIKKRLAIAEDQAQRECGGT